MVDVMHSIANLFSRPTALWGFNDIDKGEEMPIKVESEEVNGHEDVVMANADDSDGDIEILDYVPSTARSRSRLNTARSQPQANTSNSCHQPNTVSSHTQANTGSSRTQANTGSSRPQTNTHTSLPRSNTANSLPPKRRFDNALTDASNTFDGKAGDHRGRKRAESPVDLNVNESLTKKTKTRVNGEGKETPAISERTAAPVRSPAQPRQSTSHNKLSTLHKKPSLSGNLDFLGGYRAMAPTGANSHVNRDQNAAKSKTTKQSSSMDSQFGKQGATSTSRLKMPFDDDNSDEEFRERQKSPAEVKAKTSMFTSRWSKPQSPSINTTVTHQITAGRTKSNAFANHDQVHHGDASVQGSISYTPFKSRPVSQRPIDQKSENQTKVGSNMEAKTDYKSFAPDAPMTSATHIERASKAESIRNSESLKSNTSMEGQGTIIFDSKRGTYVQKHLKPVTAEGPVDHQLQRQLGTRKYQDEITEAIRKSTTGNSIQDDTLTQESKPVMAKPANQDSIAPVAPAGYHDLEKRKKAEEAAKARRQADLRRQVEADQRTLKKVESDQLQWQRQQTLVERHRDDERLKRQAAQNEESIFSERAKALSRLEHGKRPIETSVSVKAIKDARNSTLRALLKEVSAKPGTAQDPRSSRRNHQNTANNEPSKRETLPVDAPALDEKESTSTTSGIEQQTTAAQYQRILDMKARNERLRIAEREREQRERQERQEQNQLQPLPTGPVSLNSIVGQTMLAQSDITIRSNSSGTPTGPTKQKKSHRRRLGNILAEDVKVSSWIDKGMTFGEISQLLRRCGQQGRSEETVRRRYNQVRKAIKDAAIQEQLQGRLFSGCDEAMHEVNEMINGHQAPASKIINPAQLPDDAGCLPVPPKTATHLSLKANNIGPLTISPQFSFSSRTLSAPPIAEQDDQSARPSIGGKQWNDQAFQYYIEGVRQAWEDDAAEKEERETREDSPFTDEDWSTFVYQVERRELGQDSMDDGFSIDDELWVRCSHEFDTVRAANKASIEQLFRTPQGLTSGVDLSKGHNHNTSYNDGMEFHELRGSDGGVRQIRVCRSPKTYWKGVLPKSKEGWTPRTVLFIKQRTVSSSRIYDEVLDETNVTRESEIDVNNEVYTILDLANQVAIKQFVKATFTPTSAHLTLRQLQIQEEEKKFMKKLDEDELFEANAEDDEGTSIEVWVEEGDLKGPRNLD